jgi:hypothetical protein
MDEDTLPPAIEQEDDPCPPVLKICCGCSTAGISRSNLFMIS